MKSRAERYATLASLEQIAKEKRKLRKQISAQEKMLDREWNTIREAWSIVAKVKKITNYFFNVLPFGLNMFALLAKLLSRKK